MNAVRKLWRGGGGGRKIITYSILFLLGALSCLLSLQIFSINTIEISTDLNDAYYAQTLPCSRTKNYYEEVFSEQVEHLPASAKREEKRGGESKVWVVTPTFYRPEQKAELTRLAQALLPVSHFVHWLLIDDISQGSGESVSDLEKFLQKFPLSFTLLRSFPPRGEKIVGRPRGVGGRQAAMAWLRQNARDGVVYFADDDNTYDSDIFRQMQKTKRVSMWPVGLVTDYGVSSPIVNKSSGKVIGFYDGWSGLRKFPVDMAGFAINMKLFLSKPDANMPWVAGYEEDELLRSLGVTIHDIEPLANNCTQVLVWHTKTVRNAWARRPKSLKLSVEHSTNLEKLLKELPNKKYAGSASSTKSASSDDNFSLFKFFFGSS